MKSPQWAEPICGIPVAILTDLARDYACTKPASLIPSWAAGRTAYGEQYHRAASILAAITGNVGIHGGNPAVTIIPGASRVDSTSKALSAAGRIPSLPNQVEAGASPRWNALPYRGSSVNSSARVNVSLFADAILKGKSGGYSAEYKFLWLSNTNYLNQLGDVNKTARAFKELDFMLVTEQFMTPTAKFADIVLPVCTYMERNDLYVSSDGGECALLEKAVEPLGESRGQLQICDALAQKLGITDYNDKSDEDWVKTMVSKASQGGNLPDYDTFKKEGSYKRIYSEPDVPFREKIESPQSNPFPTPSGKIEIYSQRIADMNHPFLPPIPKYIETWESLNDALATKYPLQLITTHFKRRAHTQFDNLPWLQELQTQALTINTVDAGLRGIKQGDKVKVFNEG